MLVAEIDKESLGDLVTGALVGAVDERLHQGGERGPVVSAGGEAAPDSCHTASFQFFNSQERHIRE